MATLPKGPVLFLEVAMQDNKWIRYETEKKKLQEKGLTPKEYEKQIRRLCERLKI
jgi:hypothetical protein